MSKDQSEPIIRRCSCKHEYQDEKYGQGMRVHTPAKLKTGDIKPRCTVCGVEK